MPGPVKSIDAESTIVVADDFRVELVAAEPLVRDPVAMEFDENGYAYVIELPPYNEHAKPGQKTHCSIARLEDTNGDGRYDRRVTFVNDLNYATGLFCYDGGLFVGDPPDLLYLRDTDGDGRADERILVLTGFGTAPAGESQLNSFRWGLDNRLHISTGLDGGDIRRSREPEEPTRNVRNRRVLLEPRSRTFALTSGSGQHGMSFDDWGRVYVCDNSRPIQVILYDDRYIERNPLMSAPPATVNVGPSTNFTRLARISPPETWRQIRTRLREAGSEVDDTFEPGRTSGIFTSATGITIYRGDAWPEKYRGNAFVGEVANNLVYVARFKIEGLNIQAERFAPDAEFLASRDTWSRPVQFTHGPDGNLYVLDMYRQLIEGVQWVPPQVLAEMDPTAGSDRGRIYRITPMGFKQPPSVRLGNASTLELVTLLDHPNSWHRETAARLLYQRQDLRAVEPLRRLFANSSFAPGRLHAMYVLDGLASLRSEDVLLGMNDDHPRVREHAVRLAEKFAGLSKEVRQKYNELVQDSDLGVRFQLAFSLGEVPATLRNDALLTLLRNDGGDSWFRMAIQSSLAEGAADFVTLVLNDESLCNLQHGRDQIIALAKQIGRNKQTAELQRLVQSIDRTDEERLRPILEPLLTALLDGGAGISMETLAELSHGIVRRYAEALLTTARARALDPSQPTEARLDAISLLGCGSFAAEREAFDELLTPQQPQPIQEAVLKTIARFSEAGVFELLLAKWTGFTPAMRESAAEVLFSRVTWAEALLAAVEANEIARSDFDSARVALLRAHPTLSVRERAARIFSSSAIEHRANVVAEYQKTLDLIGDADRGRAVFRKSCMSCHVLEGVGTEVGPALGSVRDRGAAAILLNILDPNREIQPNYLMYVLITTDGRAITGIVTEETPNHLTLRQADSATVTVARGDIDEMHSTGNSYMPEGLEREIDLQDMADLLAYLTLAESGDQGVQTGE